MIPIFLFLTFYPFSSMDIERAVLAEVQVSKPMAYYNNSN